jgi:hypothetical protein
MSQLTALGTIIVLSLVISSVLVVTIARPLRAVLEHLCPGANAAAFWVTFTSVMLYVTPLLIAVLTVNEINPNSVGIAKSALSAELFGCFVALLVVGYQISQARTRSN